MKLKLSNKDVDIFQFHSKSSWITREEETLNKTNVGSIAMHFNVQVVSHSVNHPKPTETSSGGEGTGVNHPKHSPIIGIPVYA